MLNEDAGIVPDMVLSYVIGPNDPDFPMPIPTGEFRPLVTNGNPTLAAYNLTNHLNGDASFPSPGPIQPRTAPYPVAVEYPCPYTHGTLLGTRLPNRIGTIIRADTTGLSVYSAVSVWNPTAEYAMRMLASDHSEVKATISWDLAVPEGASVEVEGLSVTGTFYIAARVKCHVNKQWYYVPIAWSEWLDYYYTKRNGIIFNILSSGWVRVPKRYLLYASVEGFAVLRGTATYCPITAKIDFSYQ